MGNNKGTEKRKDTNDRLDAGFIEEGFRKDVPAAKREYKDSLFRMLFKEKEELLSLFNAVTGTCYENPDDLQITTLENAIYMSMKNDVSCVLDLQMHLYEHQSTVNPNMPLRYLMYIGTLYEKWVINENIYSSKRIPLPTPRFIVLYNGEQKQPERRVMRLSDSFATDTGETNLELVVQQLNINPGYNEKLKKECPTLLEYTLYVERVKKYQKEMPLSKAVEWAITECIEEGILEEFLRKNRAEVKKVSILYDFDEEKYMRMMQEEYREEGLKEGREEGRKEGRKEGREEGRREGIKLGIEQIINHMFDNSITPEEVSELTGQPVDYIAQLHEEYSQMARENIKYETEKDNG